MHQPPSQSQRVDFQERLALLLTHEVGGMLLARATGAQLAEVAEEIVAADLFQFPSFIAATAEHLRLAGADPGQADPRQFTCHHVEHLLWVQHRRAMWHSGRIRSPETVGLRLRVEGEEHARATEGHATVLITPMKVCHEDALWIARSISADREIAVYGEDMIDDDVFRPLENVVSLAGVRLIQTHPDAGLEIFRTLRRGGYLLTYPDFVYAGHKTVHAELLGVSWPFSATFLALCARPSTFLLPCHIRHAEGELVVRLEPPFQVEAPPDGEVDRRWARQLLGATVGQLLSRLILERPHQWLLLSTITAECEQRAT